MEPSSFHAGAFDPQASAVHFDQFAADGQAQACAARFAGGGGIHLREFLEDRFELICRDAHAGIFHADQDVVFFACHTDGDLAFFCEFDGVVDQVDHHLAQADFISIDLRILV